MHKPPGYRWWGLASALVLSAALSVAAQEMTGAPTAPPALETLTAASPELTQALDAVAHEQMAQAQSVLQQILATAAAPGATPAQRAAADQARLLLARLDVEQEQFAAAQPLLEQLMQQPAAVRNDQGEALLLLGLTQAGLLQRPEAVATLEKFLADYPQAPARMRVGAQVRLRELRAIQDGSLRDVADRMDDVRRQLAQGDTAAPTQDQQKKILALLDHLIDQAQQKEKEQAGGASGGRSGAQGNPASGSSGPPRGNDPSAAPAAQSVAPVGAAREGELHGTGRAEEDWLHLQERQRQQVLEALKGQFPDRYHELVEQYFKSLQEQPQAQAGQ